MEPRFFPQRRIWIKEQIMENQTIAEQMADKNQYQTFSPKATLLLNVLPADAGKTSVEPIKKQTPASQSEEPSEKLLQGLLSNMDTSSEKTRFEKRKWQLASLLTGILFTIAAAIIVWLALEIGAAGTRQNQLETENQSLREQLNLASSQITDLKNQMAAQLTRNTEPAAENAKSQAPAPVAAVSSKAVSTRNGTSYKGTTKAELIAAMGEPDRVYNSRGYEQLVYFSQKPGRFWLINGRVVQVGG